MMRDFPENVVIRRRKTGRQACHCSLRSAALHRVDRASPPDKLGYNRRSFSIGNPCFLRSGESFPGMFTAGGRTMTDIGRQAHVTPARTQIPVHSYFDEALFAKERELIFKQSSVYVGHEKMIPEPGDWRTLVQERSGRALVRDTQGVSLVSNVCRHRQALMLGGRAGNVTDPQLSTGNLRETGGRIVCPIHRWTYETNGSLIGAPDFPEKPCLNLQRYPLRDCHGLLFEGVRDPAKDMAALFSRPEFDFSDYVLDHVEIHRCNYNWKTFIEVYLEDYHVAPFHPGLGRFVTCDDLSWEFSDWYSAQFVGVNKAFNQAGSDVYRKWHERLLEYRGGQEPEFGAIWVTYFPGHMIEVYPHVLVLSTLHPVSPQETLNVVEFYYPEDIAAFERDFVQAQQAAYMETAIEDDEIAERMD